MEKFDIEKINTQLEHCANPQKEAWARNITCTQMPMLVVKSNDINMIVKSIAKDEVVPYLEAETFKYYENTVIYAKILHRVRDFELFKHYLSKLIPIMDNWATVDSIIWQAGKAPQLQVKLPRGVDECKALDDRSSNCEYGHFECEQKGYKNDFENANNLFELSKALLVDERPFARRTGVRILFKYLDDQNIDSVLSIVKTLINESEYYVNMCVAWLLCDSFIKQREKTLSFLSPENVNEFVFRKTVSKCCDSFRVSATDKTLLREQLKKIYVK